jgi:hypothetical protein
LRAGSRFPPSPAPSTILGANAEPAANFGTRQQETLIALCNFAIVAEAAPLHHGRTR